MIPSATAAHPSSATPRSSGQRRAETTAEARARHPPARPFTGRASTRAATPPRIGIDMSRTVHGTPTVGLDPRGLTRDAIRLALRRA